MIMSSVGILANPASGRDIRRLVARASVFPIAEKCSMITRLFGALGAVGVDRVFLMPDMDGLSDRVRRQLDAHRSDHEPWPEVSFVDVFVEGSPEDTLRSVEQMVAEGVGAIIVLGGDGTHRLVASACGETPITGLSTGTNNVFPAIREATVAGIATGLVVTGKVESASVTFRNKVLRVAVNGEVADSAVVDVAVTREQWVGSRALWRPEGLEQIFVAFAEAGAVGLSSIAGLLRPVSRAAPGGLRVDLAPPGAGRTVLAPIAPGLVVPVGVAGVQDLQPQSPCPISVDRGVIALDGEREIEFSPADRITVQLDRDGPLTIDVDRVMTGAAERGLLVSGESFPNEKT